MSTTTTKEQKKTILVAGCLGYIGSHICVTLLQAGYNVIGIDNLDNSNIEVADRITQVANLGKAVNDAGKKEIGYFDLQIADLASEKDICILNAIFQVHNIQAVILLAAKKSVPESIQYPLEYYKNNHCALINLLSVMQKYRNDNNGKIAPLIFSSSAAVYGDKKTIGPLHEECECLEPLSPYGASKLQEERIIRDVVYTDNKGTTGMNAICFRFANPVGSHLSGLLPEQPKGRAMNLFAVIAEILNTGKKRKLQIFGSDYSTPDGTCLRDYVSVLDIADAHLIALEKLLLLYHQQNNENENSIINMPYFRIFNLGTGKPRSVLEIFKIMHSKYICRDGSELEYEMKPRRSGDAAALFLNVDRAKSELGWIAKRDLNDMCFIAGATLKNVKT